MDNLNYLIKLNNDLLANITAFSTKNYSANQSSSSFTKNITGKFNKFPKYLTILFGLLIIVIITFFSLRNSGSNSQSTLGAADQRVDVQKPKAAQTVNKQFLFPLKGSDGVEVSKLKFEIQNAEMRDEIIIKGQKATAVEGRTFLILNLKISNSYDKAVQINARDYIRLEVNNSTEKLAPDIHNDPVEIQAISTKYTRLGFPVNDTDKNLKLQIGEITGPKETVNLNLK